MKTFSCFTSIRHNLLFVNLFFMMTLASISFAQPRLEIIDEFAPGTGAQIGIVQKIEDTVIVSHFQENIGYRLQENFPVFENDMIITGSNGKIWIGLNDQSELVVSSQTRFVLTRSIFDPRNKVRDSHIHLILGKVRCVVKTFFGFKKSAFVVKTRTAILGVRGSDFIVVAIKPYTRVVALDNTKLEIVGSAFPDAKPTIVHDFQQTYIREGNRPSPVEPVPPIDIPILKEEFKSETSSDALTYSGPSSHGEMSQAMSPMGSFDNARPAGAIQSMQPQRSDSRPGSKAVSSRDTASKSRGYGTADSSGTQNLKTKYTSPEKTIELVEPMGNTYFEKGEPLDINRGRDISSNVDVIKEQQQTIIQEAQKEDFIHTESPWFPPLPK